MPSNTVIKSPGQTNIISTSTPTPATTTTSATSPATSTTNNNKLSSSSSSSTQSSSSSTPDRPPTNNEVSQLQEALLLFYGKDPNLPISYDILSTCIINWENTHQNSNEIASLYRIRGDINMGLSQFNRAESDYSKAIQYLQQQQQQQGVRLSSIPESNEKNYEYGGEGDKEEEAKEEYIASLLGRARSIRAMGSAATASQASQASKDYETYFILTSNLDNDDTTPTTITTSGTITSGTISATANSKTNNIFFSDTIIDGIQHNPYAAWEWGMVNRVAKQYSQAALIHGLASTAFYDIGDEPRSVICFLDKGIDMALGLESVSSSGGGVGGGSGSNEGQQLAIVRDTLERAISSTVNVSGRDVELLQRLVAKEGEARIVLSGILWNTNNSKNAAELQYGTACSRLDELNADYNQRTRSGGGSESSTTLVMKSPRGASLGYSIDDIVGADMASCSRFKNEKFVQEKLVWSEGLRSAVNKFLTLSR
jgi:hypothetical protein